MKEKTLRVVITFHTTAEAMACEQTCCARGLAGSLISAPRALSADCGIAWCAPVDTRAALEKALEEEQIEFAGMHELVM